MYTKVIMPELTASAKNGTVRKWNVRVNDPVHTGDVLCTIMAGKTTGRIESSRDGVLLAVTAPDGSIVKWNGTVAFIGDAGDNVSAEDLEAAAADIVVPEQTAAASNNTGKGSSKYSGGMAGAGGAGQAEDAPSVLVIGGGPGGYVAAVRAARLGADVTLAERKKMGGTCLNVGCIPTKSLIHSGQLYQDILHGGGAGIMADSVQVDWNRVQEHKQNVTDSLTDGVEMLMDANGIRRLRGEASFLNDHEVRVVMDDGTEEILRPDRIIIATGSEPFIPDVPGYRELEDCVDSTGALNFDHIPESLIVIGAGTIAVELASAYAHFGTDVKVLVRSDVILRGMDRELTDLAQKELERQDVHFLKNTVVQAAERCEEGVCLKVVKDGEEDELRAEKVLIASGRRARIKGYGLENTGVELENGRIKVDQKMRTTVKHIFAIGDCASSIMMAHTASAMGETAAENAAGKSRSFDPRSNPTCVYISPEFAAVGMTEEEAAASGPYKVGRFPMNANGKSLISGKPAGMVKVIADESGNRLLGVHILAEHATDMISEAALAIQMRLPVNSIINTIHPHPTIAEAVREAFMDVKDIAVNKV